MPSADLIICEQERGNGVDRANRIRQLTLLSLYPWRRGALASTQLIERSQPPIQHPPPPQPGTHQHPYPWQSGRIRNLFHSSQYQVTCSPPPPPSTPNCTLLLSFPPSGAFYLFLLYSPRFAVIHCLFNHSPQERVGTRGGGNRVHSFSYKAPLLYTCEFHFLSVLIQRIIRFCGCLCVLPVCLKSFPF